MLLIDIHLDGKIAYTHCMDRLWDVSMVFFYLTNIKVNRIFFCLLFSMELETANYEIETKMSMQMKSSSCLKLSNISGSNKLIVVAGAFIIIQTNSSLKICVIHLAECKVRRKSFKTYQNATLQ